MISTGPPPHATDVFDDGKHVLLPLSCPSDCALVVTSPHSVLLPFVACRLICRLICSVERAPRPHPSHVILMLQRRYNGARHSALVAQNFVQATIPTYENCCKVLH